MSCLCSCFRRRRGRAASSESVVRHHKLQDQADPEDEANKPTSPEEYSPVAPSSPDRNKIKQPLLSPVDSVDAAGVSGVSDRPRGGAAASADGAPVVSPFYVRRSVSRGNLVLPGSELQQAIALSLRAEGVSSQPLELECVICMEPFDASNPRMPVLCQCGVNKTCFHYPCLLTWTERNDHCPTCRGPLFYEEAPADFASNGAPDGAASSS